MHNSIFDSPKNCKVVICSVLNILINYITWIIKISMGSVYLWLKPSTISVKFRADDHVTFVYSNIVSQQIVFAIFSVFQGTKFRLHRYIIFHYCSFTFLVIVAQNFLMRYFLLKYESPMCASINRKIQELESEFGSPLEHGLYKLIEV